MARLLCLSLLAFALPAFADPPLDRLDRLRTVFESRDNWCLRAFALLGIASERDDRVLAYLEKGLEDKNELVRGVAALALRDAPLDLVKAADADFIERLLNQYLVSKRNPREVDFAYALLKKIAGSDFGRNLARWKKWWADLKPTYAPVSVGRVPPPKDGEDPHGRTEALLDRLLDLQTDGLDLALALDVTGSMQPYIDAAKARLADLIDILQAIIPADKLRMALVTYDDAGLVAVPLTNKVEDVRKRLERLTAAGGGDWEEGVDKAVEEAVEHKKMDWRREAGKVVIVCGDAAAHPRDLARLYALVDQMHKDPERLAKVVLSGVKTAKAKPFLVSCVHTMLEDPKHPIPPDASEKEARRRTKECFGAIAEHGGGKYVVASHAEEVVVQLLVLSFGAEWEEEIIKFLACLRELQGAKK